MNLKETIVNDIKNNQIILYLKGTKDMPMCGFSNSVVQILNHYGVEYKDVNVLEDPMIRVKLSCLLYTSPSPRDISGSRMPSSA